MEYRFLFNMINYDEGMINLKGKIYKLKDIYLFIIDKKDLYKLIMEERNVIDKLVFLFRGSEKL